MNIIKVGWQNYLVNFLPGMEDDHGNKCNGLWDSGRSDIRINSYLDEQQKEETLIHEIIHAVDYLMCTELDELQVRGLSHGFKMLFDDNWMEILKICKKRKSDLEELLKK